VRAAGIQPVPQIRAQVRMIMLGLPRPAATFPADRGPVHPDPAGDLRLARGLLLKFLNLDPVINNRMSEMCGQGSPTPLIVI
jgi:hypothetical protein